MADTPSTEPEDGFTFVDKRRVGEESPAEVGEEKSGDEPATDAGSEGAGGSTLEADLEEALSGMPDLSATSELAKYVVGLLTMNAFQQLGLIADPRVGSARKDLTQARLAIDCVAALVGALDSPHSTLDSSTKNEFRRVLTDLRLNFVNQSRSEVQPSS